MLPVSIRFSTRFAKEATPIAINPQAAVRNHLDVFHAERHTTESHFRMATTIDCFIIE